ncbi:MAG: nucleotide sugar dehydrogenase [Pseudomonadota bacterium]
MLNQAKTTFANALPVELFVVDEKPAISVVGLGYVGAVSTACLSSLGHTVIGVDLDPVKIAQIGAGQSPIHEKDLGKLLSQGVDAGLVTATDDLTQAVIDTDVTFVSVGTPKSGDGGCDYRYIESAARSIGAGVAQKDGFHVVVMRCSIPPGTTLNVMTPIIEQVSGKVLGEDFGVCFNPEFLREGVAVADFYAPPKTVIGATCERSGNILRQVYLPVDENVIVTSIETAEMVKYVDNVWHATKVTFANEVGRLCKPLGVDSHDVMDIFVQDTKLNLSPYYLKPGFAYGGSCLPKEVRAVAHIAEKQGVNLPLIQSLGASNAEHIDAATDMVRKTGAREVAILGLAFKPGTDDLRESPILETIAALHAEGVQVKIHDPAITRDTPLEAQLSYVQHGSKGLAAVAPHLADMICDSVKDATAGVGAIVVTQKSDTYRNAAALASIADVPVIDVVRLFDGAQPRSCTGIGW